MIKAPKAWSLTGRVIDRGQETPGTCSLCSRPTRFLYEAKVRGQSASQRSAWAGPECAGNFHNPAAETENLEPHVWLLKNRAQLIRLAKQSRLIDLLNEGDRKGSKVKLSTMIPSIKKGDRLTPKQAAMVSSIFGQLGIAFDADIIPVALNSGDLQDQVVGMPDWQLENLMKVLSAKQQTLVKKLRLLLPVNQDIGE